MAKNFMRTRILVVLISILSSFLLPVFTIRGPSAFIEASLDPTAGANLSVIVTADSALAAAQAVERMSGQVTSELWLINAVAATLPADKLHALAAAPGILSIVENKGIETAEDDGWVTERRVKKGTYSLNDTYKGASVGIADGGLFVMSENGKGLIVNGDGSERARFEVTAGKPFKTRPVVAANGTIYVAGESKRIYAFNPDGSQKWVFAGSTHNFIGGVILGREGAVYAADEGRNLYSIQLETGVQNWKFQAPLGNKVKATPTVGADGTIYLMTEGGYVYALTPAGQVLWSYQAGSGAPFLKSALLSDQGLLYLVGEEKRVFAIHATTGSLLYQFNTTSKIKAQPALGRDGSLYLAAENRSLYALNPDGSLRFEFRPPTGTFQTAPTLALDGTQVYVAAKEKTLYAVDTLTGNPIWTYKSSGDLVASPVIDPFGKIHLGDVQGGYAILKPNGDVSFRTQTQGISYSLIVTADTNVYVSSGLQKLELWDRLPDTWDGSSDVIASDGNKKLYQLVNPVGIDIGADALHESLLLNGKPITGEGITIAVLDTGVYFTKEVKEVLGKELEKLFQGQVDFVGDGMCNLPGIDQNAIQYDGYCFTDHKTSYDPYGHGTHMAGIIWNNLKDASTGVYMGIAPGTRILSVRVMGSSGNGSYEDLIEGIQYVVANQAKYDIRVLNLSLSAPQTTPYFIDPLNRAVEAAWAAGIVVVTAAGNTGPGAETITVPGNDPYVITVGAISSNRTPGYWADDYLPWWSATGPTLDGFIKPDVLAPGSQIVSFMYNDPNDPANSSYLARIHPDYAETTSLFRLNGTSTSSAMTAGVVALMLQANPNLTPDQVKFRLMYTARQLLTNDEALGMNFLQQGAGRIWAPDAVLGNLPEGYANTGMDVLGDLAHGWGSFDADGRPILDETELAYHYMGAVRKVASEDGSAFLYYLEHADGSALALGAADSTNNGWILADQIVENTTWAGGNMVWSGGNMVWSGGNMVWSGGNMVWSGGNMVWSGGNMVWSGGNMVWSGGNMVWSGGNMVWSGSNMIWSGGNMVWSGGNMVWSGATDWANGLNASTTNASTVLWVEE